MIGMEGINMNIIDEREIQQSISTNKNINFLAYAYTPWHAHGIMAVIEFLKEVGIKPEGFICICKHAQAGYILDDSYFEGISAGINVCSYNDVNESGGNHIKGYLMQMVEPIKKNGRQVVLVIPNYFDAMKYSKRVSVVEDGYLENYIVDEGLATYMRKEKSFYGDISEETILKRIWFHIRLGFLDKIYMNKIKSKSLISDFRVLKWKDGNLLPNNVAISYYKKAIKPSNSDGRNEISSMYENAVVINTQPFFDENAVKKNEDVRIVIAVCKAIYNVGMKIILKPHPREKNIERYSAVKEYATIDMNKNISQESIIASLSKKPVAIIAFSSTTLVSAKLFFDIKTFSIAKFWDRLNISDKLQEEENNFLDIFSNFVSCPDSMNELVSLLTADKKRTEEMVNIYV